MESDSVMAEAEQLPPRQLFRAWMIKAQFPNRIHGLSIVLTRHVRGEALSGPTRRNRRRQLPGYLAAAPRQRPGKPFSRPWRLPAVRM